MGKKTKTDADRLYLTLFKRATITTVQGIKSGFIHIQVSVEFQGASGTANTLADPEGTTDLLSKPLNEMEPYSGIPTEIKTNRQPDSII